MELLLIAVIVGLAVFFIARSFSRMFRSAEKNGCACGCGSCGVQDDACDEKDPGKSLLDEKTPRSL